MNVLLISASPHRKKSRTYLLAKEVLKGCSVDNSEAEIIYLGDHELKFCQHLEECHRNIMDCPIEDDMSMILEKMLEADGIIIASPNYINQVTASMKTVFDRSSHFIHCQRLLEKYIVGIVSSGSGQDKNVLNYIKYYGNICGAQYTGGISSKVPVQGKKMERAYEIGERLTLDIKRRMEYSEQIRVIEEGKEHFRNLIQMRKNEWTGEYQYWVAKGWL